MCFAADFKEKFCVFLHESKFLFSLIWSKFCCVKERGLNKTEVPFRHVGFPFFFMAIFYFLLNFARLISRVIDFFLLKFFTIMDIFLQRKLVVSLVVVLIIFFF